MSARIPFDAAEAYRLAGWSGTLALPARSKAPPPEGCTGTDGRWPTPDDLATWRLDGLQNIALRPPPKVIGIDVDAYPPKVGAATLADLETRWGALPATWTSTSRDDGSGIRLYRVPVLDAVWPTAAGKDIEIIRYGHRYAVVWPSIHPSGRTYRWIRPDGTNADDDEIPAIGELADLPAAWLAGLTGTTSNGTDPTHVRPGSRAEQRQRATEARAWLRTLPAGPPCAYAGRLAADADAAARREAGAAYDATRDVVLALVRAGAEGHSGIVDILNRTKVTYIATVGSGRGGDAVAAAEYERFTLGAALKVGIDAEPLARCDCQPVGNSPTMDNSTTLAAGASPDDEAGPLTYRTLADIDDSPPGDLVLGMFEDGPNGIFGPGGVGKGSTGAWIIRETAALGYRWLIWDAEGHPREWRRRCTGLGVDPSTVVYVQTSDLPHHLLGQPLHLVVPHLDRIADAAGANAIIVDSIMAAAACAGTSEEGLKSDTAAPYLYTAALVETGKLSISIGHTTKGNPDGEMYGSVAWTNAARLTWHCAKAEGDGHRVRWTARKRNERGHLPAVLLTFAYNELGVLTSVGREDDEQATRGWLTDALIRGPRTVEDLADELAEMDDAPPSVASVKAKDRVRQALGRMRRAGLAHKTGGRGAPWALGAQPPRRNGG